MNQEPIQNRGESIPVKTSRSDWGQKEPFHGPYRLQEVGTNTDRICPVDIPQNEPILVSLDVFAAALRKLEMNFGRQVEHPRRLTNLLPGKQGLSNS